MEVPATATIVFGTADVEFTTESYSGQATFIAERVAEQVLQVEKERDFLDDDNEIKLPLFGKVIDGAVAGQKLVFGSKSHVWYSIDSFVPVGDYLFVQRANMVDPSGDELKATINDFNRVAGYFLARAENEIPVEEGMCIEGGFIPFPLAYEKARIGVRLKEFPDVHFSVEVHKNRDRLPESSDLETLLARAEHVAKMQGLGAAYASITTFRRGPRQLRDWKGYEILARKPAFKSDTDAHEFRFRSLGAVNDPLQPQLDVQFDTGVGKNRKAAIRPTITDEEAVALWDRLVDTIRVRKAHDATVIPAPKAPLGALAPSGEACVQTGWWQCMDPNNIDGDKRHLIVAGDLLPPAAVFTKPTLWQRFTGQRPVRQRSATWQLVGYNDLARTDSTSTGREVKEDA
ncbi:hypothetical protein D3872_11470 [Massilia cavernae]|uniref:Tle cognate immunity protein 4 C-terminal domain-containing protein n=2 Tax=Massilia cavernae TaxID=2320864 RepID=A0A418XTV5_9BURK|nr:hypothetical protein D3872_11470 [Massilia cavernae]